MTNKEQIEAYLKDIPSKWRAQLVEVLCSIKDTISCDKVKECETVTSLSDFTVNGGTVSIKYTDEKSVQVTRSFTVSDILNTQINNISPGCITSQLDWNGMTYSQRLQALIDSHCECCGND